MAQTEQQVYTHAAEPRAVAQGRPKYRDQDAYAYPANIMFDRRVVRGNTYAAQILAAEPHILEKKTIPSTRSRSVRREAPRTPEAVEGRRHTDIQTDSYLEELTDTVPEVDTCTQTDPFMDRPPTPLFVPQKSGVDATTQIDQGDLFDFEYEVEPILEVLVGKILEQGLMEVMEEEELAAVRAHQEHMEQIRNAELVATQRMEAAEKRKVEEKERRLAQEKERVERERIVREKVAASTFARGYLTGLVGTVFHRLEQDGFFYDPVEQEVEAEFMPWLRTQNLKRLTRELTLRQVVASIVERAAEGLVEAKKQAEANAAQAIENTQKYAEKEAAAAAALQEEVEEEIQQKSHFILNDLSEPIASPEAVSEVRDELTAKAEEEAKAAFAEATQKAEEEAKAKYKEGKEEDQIDEAEEAAAVEAAVAEVPQPDPKPVTDDDVLSAMLEKGVVTKENITRALAVHGMGEKAYTNFKPAEGEETAQ